MLLVDKINLKVFALGSRIAGLARLLPEAQPAAQVHLVRRISALARQRLRYLTAAHRALRREVRRWGRAEEVRIREEARAAHEAVTELTARALRRGATNLREVLD